MLCLTKVFRAQRWRIGYSKNSMSMKGCSDNASGFYKWGSVSRAAHTSQLDDNVSASVEGQHVRGNAYKARGLPGGFAHESDGARQLPR